MEKTSNCKTNSLYYTELLRILRDMCGITFSPVMYKRSIKYLFSDVLQYRIGRRKVKRYDKYAKYDIELPKKMDERVPVLLKMRLIELLKTRPRYCGDIRVLIAKIESYPICTYTYEVLSDSQKMDNLDGYTEFNPYSIVPASNDWIEFEDHTKLPL